MAVIVDTVSGSPAPPRHPEKAHRPDQPVLRKPDWIRVKAPVSRGYAETRDIVRANGLHTVCEEAGCPNIGECWEKKHATFMIMGDTCTRACAFCNVKTGLPGALDPDEPAHVAEATAKLGLAHVVITSVDRDDLADGGAAHFAAVIRAIRSALPADHDRGADAGFPAQGRRGRNRGRGAARRVQPQSRNRAVEISDRASRRALFRLDAPVAAGQGARPADVHQIGHHGGPRRRAERSAAGDGRSARGRRRFPHHRAISAAHRASIIRSCASCRRTSSRRWRRSPMPKASRWSPQAR